MNTRPLVLFLAVVVLAFGSVVKAQRVGGVGDRPGVRNPGGVNQGQPPGEYVVDSVDNYARMVRLRAADGSTREVFVPDGVYDVSKLKGGDKVQVNFLEPDGQGGKLSAGNIWPVK
jgi:hypothetical protein